MTHDPASDPYRWAADLAATKLPADAIERRLIEGGVDADLARIVVTSIRDNQARLKLWKVVAGISIVSTMGMVGYFLLERLMDTGSGSLFPIPLALGAAYGLFLTWDGVRGR